MNNFWNSNNSPILALAPMAGITDSAFRRICKEFGADILYSEMASATALFYNPKETLDILKFDESERPYVVQLFGSDPLHFATATKIVAEKIRPDGIDINFGCPVPKVAKQGAGATLFQNIAKSKEAVKAVIGSTDIPVSIKTRTLAGGMDILRFLKGLENLDIKALMIHGRSLKQGFSGPIDTEIIRQARNYFPGVILANGGIHNLADAQKILVETSADGIGLGRGALGRPWIFKDIKMQRPEDRSEKEIFEIALKHARIAQELKGSPGLIEMRKHLCWYVQGLPGAKRMREKLVRVATLQEIEEIFNDSI